MTIYINPGSGPVVGATLENAAENMRAFLEDLVARGHTVSNLQYQRDEGDGRYTFTFVVTDAREEPTEIEMPGLPLDRVRWIGEPDQNIWDFPRLYVNGSSWVWKYALNACGPDD